MKDELMRGPFPYVKKYEAWKGDLSRVWTGITFECRSEIDCDWYEPQWETGVCAHRYNGILCASREAHKKTLDRLARKARALAKEIEARA